jgi:transcription-repair coupling factor (superfamily II helicase)
VPRPMTKRVGGEPLRDVPLLQWCEELVTTLLGGQPGTDAPGSR